MEKCAAAALPRPQHAFAATNETLSAVCSQAIKVTGEDEFPIESGDSKRNHNGRVTKKNNRGGPTLVQTWMILFN